MGRTARVIVPAPLPHQVPILASPARFKVVASGRRFGKALDLGTAVPTPSGWTTMGALREGDLVFDERGEPTRIIFATDAYMPESCYRVRFDDGAEVVADGEHRWQTWTKLERRRSVRRLRNPKMRATPSATASFLAAILRDGPVPAKEVHAAARRARVSNAALRRVAARAGVVFERRSTIGSSRGKGCWLWTWRLDGDLEVGVRTTREIAATLRYNNYESNHSIPVAGPLRFAPGLPLPLDPYFLGLWLGDGTSAAPAITTADAEIRDYWTEYARRHGLRCHTSHDPRASCVTIRISAATRGQPNTVLHRLRQIGVLANKHIPWSYLSASREVREDLLAGLMDTDGTCDERGWCELMLTRDALARDAFDLALGLGHKVRMKESDAKIYGRVVGRRFRISFKPSRPVFRLPRKLARQQPHCDLRCSHRYIEAVEPVELRPVRCIQVEAASRLYLVTRSLIATHNTKMAEIALTEGHGGRLADGSSLRRGLLDGAEILWAAPSYPEIVASGVWRDLKASLADYAARVNESERRIELPRAGAVTVKSTENEDSVRGGAYDGVVFDEAASHAPTIWREVIRPSLADRRGWAMFIGRRRASTTGSATSTRTRNQLSMPFGVPMNIAQPRRSARLGRMTSRQMVGAWLAASSKTTPS